jgi:nitrate/TMAO reductase-like tetraheme cytochrome c subunit
MAADPDPSQSSQEPNSAEASSEVPPGAVPELVAPAFRKKRRWPWWLLAVAAVGFLFVFFIVSTELLHYTESTEFCSLCHVMHPEVTAYENSPHARAECGTCHIGPGAIAAVKAKLANVRYLWVYPLGLYEKPIPSPITSLRPVEVVCEQCHWPEKYYADRLVVIPDFAEDEANSLTETAIAIRTGGGRESEGLGRGIHWHIDNPVYYIATDEDRQDIPWVQAEYDGKITEYVSTDSNLTPEALARYEKRKMDCVDCHNRASHNFRRPSDVMDVAMAAGALPADLPYLKQQGVRVLETKYATEEEAAAAIAGVEDWYRTNQSHVYAAREADVKGAVAGLQEIFDRTQFPFMNLDWQSHQSNIGHKEFAGCFRCHDGKHLSSENEAVRLECNLCHTIPQVALPGQELPPVPVAPGPEPESHMSTTWLAEHRFKFDASCAACHTVENPGGADNTSFCSNSACHATEWVYAGLNAPEIRELSAPPKAPSTGQPNPIPHPVSATIDCTRCHGTGGVRPWPDSHSGFTPDMCAGCHTATLQEPSPVPEPESTAEAPEGGAAPAIPHELAGREDCSLCHGQGAARPFPANHAAFTDAQCTGCHVATTLPEPAATPAFAPTPEASPEATAEPPPDATSAPSGGVPLPIPHELAGRENCEVCHRRGAMNPFPAGHAGYSADMCTSCHQPVAVKGETPTPAPDGDEGDEEEPTAGGPPLIPHELEGRSDCLLCHDPEGGLKPAPGDHAGRTSDSCQICHKPEA